MSLRPSVADLAFDPQLLSDLRARFRSGELAAQGQRLQQAPTALIEGDLQRSQPDDEVSALGEAALKSGKVALLILNGGMAMRFGGGVAKGTVDLGLSRPISFLEFQLKRVTRLSQQLGARIPVAIMHSFATRHSSREHLETIAWGGVAETERIEFEQSILPRLAESGDLPLESGLADETWADHELYCAPGHGDTLRRVRDSGTLDRLADRGVEHLLVCNVDNLGAYLDTELLGRHLRSVAAGANISVEVVRRAEHDRGGCIARLDGKPMIIEANRLPESSSLADYPVFNTNTLWFSLDSLRRELPLQWFAVHRQLERGGQTHQLVQFEQLIGQATEFLPSRFIEVDRERRFLPVKTREDLAAMRPAIEAQLAQL